MNSRERILVALDHREPDKVPFDLGGTDASGIHVTAYQRLRAILGLPPVRPRIIDVNQQLADIDEDVRRVLGGDARWVFPPGSYFATDNAVRDDGQYWTYFDEWGVGWHMPKDGYFYDMFHHPLAFAETTTDVTNYKWPRVDEPRRYHGLGDLARGVQAEGHAVVVNSLCSGLTEMHAWLRGYEQFYLDLAANHRMAELVMDKVLELKMAYWERAMEEVGGNVDVVEEYDDLGGQDRLLFSPEVYRKIVKPRHRELFAFIKRLAPVKIMIHCCGAVRPLIPDLIEVGVDILNPVQITAVGMDSGPLKSDFGKDIVFWGGGVDTQRLLAFGTPEQVRQDVKRRVGDFAPGGGFVFATVHNIQANVPAPNIVAMWEALQDCGY